MSKLLRYMTVGAVLLVGTVAVADKIDDFRSAANNTGCDAIPYSDLGSQCRAQQSDVHPRCDASSGYAVSCERGVTRSLEAERAREQRGLEDLQARRREIDDRKSRATTDADKGRATTDLEAIDRDIEAAKKRVSDNATARSSRKEAVATTIYNLNRCIDSRKAVMYVFASTGDRLRGESDQALRPYINTLKEKYAGSIQGHEQAIQDKKNALDTCMDERP